MQYISIPLTTILNRSLMLRKKQFLLFDVSNTFIKHFIILNVYLLLSDSLSAKLCLDTPFYQLQTSIGNGFSYASERRIQVYQYSISCLKLQLMTVSRQVKNMVEQMKHLCYDPENSSTTIPSKILHSHIPSKKNWTQEIVQSSHDNVEEELSLQKLKWINLSCVWRPAQVLYFPLRLMTILFFPFTIESCINYLIRLKMSFILISTRFVNDISQHFTTHYLKMERSFTSLLTRGFTRFFILYSCFSGVHVDGAKGGFKCSSVTAQTACLPQNYSKFELPNPTGVNPISVEILIEEVLRINDKDYSITFSCYYNINWPDKRIFLTPEFGLEQMKSMKPNTNITMNPDIIVPMNLEMTKDLWLPNVMIYNLKTYKVMDVLSKLAGLWIRADYVVAYSEATHITFICPMHFDKFPLDTQTCKFLVGSYSYDDSQMTFKTSSAKYNNKDSNSIALDYEIEIKPLTAEDSLLIFEGLGNFSLAGFELVLRRYVSTYIITYYLPSGLFVIVSWISFLIPMDVIPGRMALLVTLFLVLVNIFNNVTTNTPKAEGLTAIEAWMLACILFVFGALIE